MDGLGMTDVFALIQARRVEYYKSWKDQTKQDYFGFEMF